MKKLIYLIVLALILGLVFAGCGDIMNVSVPTAETERAVVDITCGDTYATEVVDYYQGYQYNGGSIASDRWNPDNATGPLDHYFFSPGFFFPLGNPYEQTERGWIILDFGQMVGGCINVLETSPELTANYPLEQAKVWVTDDLANDWVYLGMATNQTPEIDTTSRWSSHPNVFTLGGCIRYVKIIDMTDPYLYTSRPTSDGFDVDAVYAGECVPVGVPVDIKPTSCPNPLNTKSKGVTPVAILGTADFDVTEIDPETIKLIGILTDVSPLSWNWEDVATPFEPYTGKEDCDLDCNTEGPDGYLDLTLKFDTQKLLDAIGTVESFEVSEEELNALESGEIDQVTTSNGEILFDGACLVIQLKGALIDCTPIIGEDVVRILKKGNK